MKYGMWLFLAVLLLGLAGAAQAALTPMFPNSDFEMQDLTNWHTTGQCWTGHAPTVGTAFTAAPEGHWCASSTSEAGDWPEGLTGELISAPFTVPSGFDTATFYVAGWADPGEHIDFKLASDNSVIATQQVPATNPAFAKVSVTGFSAYAGKQIYIDVVDNNVGNDPSAASGWIAVDAFSWDDGQPPPANPNLLFDNSDFEKGDLTNWTPNGDAWNHMPTKGNPFGGTIDGTYCMASTDEAADPESNTGTLTSVPFTVPSGKDTIQFYIAGWATPDFRVEFRKKSDDSVVTTKGMQTTSASPLLVQVSGFSAYAGQQLYIVAVDNGTTDLSSNGAGWYGWFMVDGFEWAKAATVVENPDRCFDNAGFEEGNWTNWTAAGSFGSAPAITNGWNGVAEGTYCASSATDFSNGGAGTLTSKPFTMAHAVIAFQMSGWVDGGTADKTCVVNLRLASDNSLIDSTSMPWTTQGYEKRTLSADSSVLGKQVYLEVIDTDATNTGAGSWIGVDDFHFIITPNNARQWSIYQ